MARIIKKNECEFIDGYIVKDGETVNLPANVRLLIERLELMLQQYKYLKGQKPYSPGPSLEGFEFKSALHKGVADLFEIPETPGLDAKLAEAFALMDEIDTMKAAKDLNDVIRKFEPLFEFASKDHFFEGMVSGAAPIDCITIGNPLELTVDQIKAALQTIVDSPVEMV